MIAGAPIPNRHHQFVMLWFVAQGSHESFLGDEEIGVDLQWRRVHLPIDFGGLMSQGGFVDGSDEDTHDELTGMFHQFVEILWLPTTWNESNWLMHDEENVDIVQYL
jgi:hypothetical protein